MNIASFSDFYICKSLHIFSHSQVNCECRGKEVMIYKTGLPLSLTPRDMFAGVQICMSFLYVKG